MVIQVVRTRLRGLFAELSIYYNATQPACWVRCQYGAVKFNVLAYWVLHSLQT